MCSIPASHRESTRNQGQLVEFNGLSIRPQAGYFGAIPTPVDLVGNPVKPGGELTFRDSRSPFSARSSDRARCAAT
jgi:hypothetical protein